MTVDRLEFFFNYLNTVRMKKMLTASGGEVVPLGFDRLKVVEWLFQVIQLRDLDICSKLRELNFPKILLEMISFFEMNSFLHSKIFAIFNEALKSNTEPYVLAFSIDCELAERILELYERSQGGMYLSTKKNFKKPYFSYLIALVSDLCAASRMYKKVRDYLSSVKGWEKFMTGTYNVIAAKENKKLCSLSSQPDTVSEEWIEKDATLEEREDNSIDGKKEENVEVILPSKKDRLKKMKQSSGKSETTELEESALILEEPLLFEYASNTYWKCRSDMSIEDLEKDFF
eukprot:TRINITY_DN2583_c0_g1_i15.p2 TRINITY_DN2583_c0_g1~~TRINITY_DN2583_c0_g1_i15.p2  ORF type:complete len:287 (+),score=43.27 TRINITY_DN2583_c0_g1_i15:906-1766(+)